MNETRIDKLFDEKLASFEVRPSASAWGKIESGISKKDQSKGRYIWYAIAASITLAITTAVLLTNKADMNEDILARQNEIPENEEAFAVIEIEDQIQTTQISSEVSEVDAPGTILTKDIDQENWLTVINPEIENFELAEKQDLLSPVSNVPLSIQKQNFKIVMVSVRFNPSFELIPISELAIEVTHESGFKKAYQYAKRVKNGEEPLFNLRKAKNDLFAMAKNIKLNNQSKPN